MDKEGSFELTDEQLARSRLVVVDDEHLVTTSLRNFLLLELEVEATTFNDAVEALRFIERETIDLVISDFLMPELDGVQFLSQVRQLQPEVPRILLTGYADKENAIRAINQVQLFQYVEKPWENNQFVRVIRAGLERRFLLRMLTDQVEKLATTRSDLERLRKGLVRAFS